MKESKSAKTAPRSRPYERRVRFLVQPLYSVVSDEFFDGDQNKFDAIIYENYCLFVKVVDLLFPALWMSVELSCNIFSRCDQQVNVKPVVDIM